MVASLLQHKGAVSSTLVSTTCDALPPSPSPSLTPSSSLRPSLAPLSFSRGHMAATAMARHSLCLSMRRPVMLFRSPSTRCDVRSAWCHALFYLYAVPLVRDDAWPDKGFLRSTAAITQASTALLRMVAGPQAEITVGSKPLPALPTELSEQLENAAGNLLLVLLTMLAMAGVLPGTRGTLRTASLRSIVSLTKIRCPGSVVCSAMLHMLVLLAWDNPSSADTDTCASCVRAIGLVFSVSGPRGGIKQQARAASSRYNLCNCPRARMHGLKPGCSRAHLLRCAQWAGAPRSAFWLANYIFDFSLSCVVLLATVRAAEFMPCCLCRGWCRRAVLCIGLGMARVAC